MTSAPGHRGVLPGVEGYGLTCRLPAYQALPTHGGMSISSHPIGVGFPIPPTGLSPHGVHALGGSGCPVYWTPAGACLFQLPRCSQFEIVRREKVAPYPHL